MYMSTTRVRNHYFLFKISYISTTQKNFNNFKTLVVMKVPHENLILNTIEIQ